MLRQFSDIKVFVISLAREKQRREAIQKRLNNICNTFEFFDAIDGKKNGSLDGKRQSTLSLLGRLN